MIDNSLLSDIAGKYGIDLVGIVNKTLLSNISDQVISANSGRKLAFFNGDISERLDYKREMEDAEGIIAFGISYASSLKMPDDGENRLRISKCSYGEDYHEVLMRAGKALAEDIFSASDSKYKVFSDTGIFLDRIAAYCAGLGFYGKNNFIISEQYGSFVFLGHILTDMPLDCDVCAAPNLCGTCEKCLNACPAKAYKDSILDYEKCASFITQKTGGYGRGGYIYGCDICQDVCPFNLTAPKDLHECFSTTIDKAFPKAEKLVNMKKSEFQSLYGDSSLAWRGFERIKNNAVMYLSKKNKTDISAEQHKMDFHQDH